MLRSTYIAYLITHESHISWHVGPQTQQPKDFRCFTQANPLNIEKFLKLGHDCFIPYPLQFIIH